jgi:hypothetical protein
VNERLQEVSREFGTSNGELDLVCECGDASCVERIAVPISEYESVRADPRLFAVVPGHVAPDVERLVEQRKGYDVVMKSDGPATQIAEETDPRK